MKSWLEESNFNTWAWGFSLDPENGTGEPPLLMGGAAAVKSAQQCAEQSKIPVMTGRIYSKHEQVFITFLYLYWTRSELSFCLHKCKQYCLICKSSAQVFCKLITLIFILRKAKSKEKWEKFFTLSYRRVRSGENGDRLCEVAHPWKRASLCLSLYVCMYT